LQTGLDSINTTSVLDTGFHKLICGISIDVLDISVSSGVNLTVQDSGGGDFIIILEGGHVTIADSIVPLTVSEARY